MRRRQDAGDGDAAAGRSQAARHARRRAHAAGHGARAARRRQVQGRAGRAPKRWRRRRRQLGYRPLVAETQALVGELRFKSGDYAGADRAWRDALYAAEEARLDGLKSRVAVELANVTVDLHGFAEAHEWMRFAEAMVRRAGAAGGVQVDLWVQIALVYFRESRYPEAESAARKAVALAAGMQPKNPLVRANAYRTLGDVLKYEGRYDEGLQLLEQARTLTESVLGPEHPEVAASCARRSTPTR